MIEMNNSTNKMAATQAHQAPAFKVPSEWTDEDRMYYLLAPFTKSNELILSDSKTKFWRSLILSSSKELGECVFTVRQLCERLKWREMPPKCIPNVVEAMERTAEVMKASSYRVDQGWVGWGVSVVTSPVSWAWKRYVSSGSAASDDNEEYVIVSHAKELADRVFTSLTKDMVHSTTDCLHTCSEFDEKCNIILNHPSSHCVKVVQLELIKQGLAVTGVAPDTQITVVKLSASKDQSVGPLGESDFGIISIKITLDKLQSQITEKSMAQERLKQKCVQLSKNNQKSRALHFLRMSKAIEAQILRLEQHSENLQTVLNQIEMAKTNAEILKAYETGNKALKKVTEDNQLTLERAEEVMDEFKQLVEDGEDINNVLNKDLHEDDFSDDELLVELNSLLVQDSKPGTVSCTVPEPDSTGLAHHVVPPVKDLEALTLTDHDVVCPPSKHSGTHGSKSVKKSPIMLTS